MMLSPRIRRLQSELDGMLELQRNSSHLKFEAEGSPPTHYRVTLTCLGVQRLNGALAPAVRHEFELVLQPDFPLAAPTIVWKTGIFHPNFRVPHVCLGDMWYPGWTIADMCVSLCEMVQYKSFNIYDPLDAEAARWLAYQLDHNPKAFPIDETPVRDLAFDIGPVTQSIEDGQG